MKKTFLLFTWCVLLAACAPENKPASVVSATADPLSLKETRTDQVMEALYQQLKEQRPELQELEQQVEAVDQLKNKALQEYYQYNHKNEQYYTTANQHLDNIKDSLLRNSIELLLNKSQYAYDQENAAMALSAATLENRSVSLHDHQEALKIILTLNLMEKYQKQQLPDAVEYKKIMDRYTATLHSADSLLQTK